MGLFDPVGTSWGSSLNWSQSASLARTAENTRPGSSGIDMTPVIRELRSLGVDIHEVAGAVASLEQELVLRLDAQTDMLDKQLDVLEQIAEILRNPLRTRAAERVRTANELLRHHRFERALEVTDQAIDDDPNNDLAFIIGGWASFGLKMIDLARVYFREAKQATSGTKGAEGRRMHAARLAARMTFGLEGPEAAWQELNATDYVSEHLELNESQFLFALYYDLAAYAAATNRTQDAIQYFSRCSPTKAKCYLALTDPLIMNNEKVAAEVMGRLGRILAAIKRADPYIDVGIEGWKRISARTARHQIDIERVVPPVIFSYLKGWPERRSATFWDEYTEEAILTAMGTWKTYLKTAVSCINDDPRIDREVHKENVLERGLQQLNNSEIIFRGRVDAIVQRAIFRKRFYYLVADAVKPNVCLRTYEMSPDEYKAARSEILTNNSRRGPDAPQLSPLISRRPDHLARTSTWSPNSNSAAWPEDYE